MAAASTSPCAATAGFSDRPRGAPRSAAGGAAQGADEVRLPVARNLPHGQPVRKGFHDLYSNSGHYEGLAGDGLSECHPAFLQLATSLEGCARRYAHDCRRYRPRAKPARQPGWGSKLLGRDPSAGSSSSVLGKGGRPVAPGQQVLPWHGGGQVAALPQDWQQGAEHFRRVNGSRPRPRGPRPEGIGARWDQNQINRP